MIKFSTTICLVIALFALFGSSLSQEALPVGHATLTYFSPVSKTISVTSSGSIALHYENHIYIYDEDRKLAHTLDLSEVYHEYKYAVNGVFFNLYNYYKVGNHLYLSDEDMLYFFTLFGTLELDLSQIDEYYQVAISDIDTTYKNQDFEPGKIYDMHSDTIVPQRYFYDDGIMTSVFVRDFRYNGQPFRVLDSILVFEVPNRTKTDFTEKVNELLPILDSGDFSKYYVENGFLYRLDLSQRANREYDFTIFRLPLSSGSVGPDTLIASEIPDLPNILVQNGEIFLSFVKSGGFSPDTMMVYKVDSGSLYLEELLISDDNLKRYDLQYVSDDVCTLLDVTEDRPYTFSNAWYIIFDRYSGNLRNLRSRKMMYHDIAIDNLPNSVFVWEKGEGLYIEDIVDEHRDKLVIPQGDFWEIGKYDVQWMRMYNYDAQPYIYYRTMFSDEDGVTTIELEGLKLTDFNSILKPKIVGEDEIVYMAGRRVVFAEKSDISKIKYYYELPEFYYESDMENFICNDTKHLLSASDRGRNIDVLKVEPPKKNGKNNPDIKEETYSICSNDVLPTNEIYYFDDGTFTFISTFYSENINNWTYGLEERSSRIDSVRITSYNEEMQENKSYLYVVGSDDINTIKRLHTMSGVYKKRTFDTEHHDAKSKTIRCADGGIYDLYNLEYSGQSQDTPMQMQSFNIPDSFGLGVRYSAEISEPTWEYIYNVEIYDLNNPSKSIELLPDTPIEGFLGYQSGYLRLLGLGRTYHKVPVDEIIKLFTGVTEQLAAQDKTAQKLYLTYNLDDFLKTKNIIDFAIHSTSGIAADRYRLSNGIYYVSDNQNGKQYYILIQR